MGRGEVRSIRSDCWDGEGGGVLHAAGRCIGDFVERRHGDLFEGEYIYLAQRARQSNESVVNSDITVYTESAELKNN